MTPPSATTAARGGRLRCLLLGEEPLLLHCAELLVGRGHLVAAMVSRSATVERWAAEHAIPVVGRADYPALVERDPPDVILSITHPALIPAAVLGRARVAAINYHDGPLPRYAGINGSAWALHNGETSHAVVWHHLTAGLDDGDILERREFALDPRETSLSLNMKNAALALDGFRAIVDRLELRRLDGTAQSRTVERTVFSRHDRPPALCVVDWTDTAEAIDRLIRACDFGGYPNRFGLAKIVHHERAIVVRESLVEGGVGLPGTVLGIGSDGWVVACGAGALRLRGFVQPAGTPLTPVQAADALGIRTGESLTFMGRGDAETWSRSFAESEPACVAGLAELNVPQLPFARATRATNDGPATCPLALPPGLTAHFGDTLADAVLTAFCAALAAVVRDDRFDLAVASARPLPPALHALGCPLSPWRIELDAQRGFDHARRQLARQRAELARRPGFLLDLVARHPSLRQQADLQRGQLSTVAILDETSALPPGTGLALRSGPAGHTLLSDGRLAPDDLAAFAGWMGNLLAAAAADATRPLTELDLLDQAQRGRQLYTWNATARAFPDTLRIHDLFDARAREQPDATALLCDGRSMTFAEVEAGANRIAQALQARAIGPGQYVGLLVERGFPLVLAMLGIAKSGAAYVPVDTTYPSDRGRFMLEDAGCVALVTTAALADRCPGIPLLLLDGDEIAQAPSHRPTSSATADDACYAIFTSGSTGKPKGAVLTHRAVVNTLDWVNRTFAVSPCDRLLFITSPSFDLSVYDVFGALGAGASVEIASAATLRDPQLLAQRLAGGEVSLWDSAPPALARLIAFLPPPEPHPRLRLAMLSGDWIPVGLPGELVRAFPGVRVASLGGATEAAIWSNYYDVRAVDPAWPSIPYGYPIQNCRYYILDHHLRPLPAGIVGDLYIGGVCLARGYLQRPELTRERFLPDPFLPGERMYKTGDLARYGTDGTMEFRGRADAQVKVRGFRVELGEVESVLGALPSVRQAVCIARPDASGQKSLVAYVVAPAGFDVRAAKAHLGATLPDFMVPSFIVPLEALPLGPNGKLDRKALPAPESRRDKRTLRPARTPTERRLTTLWQHLLQRGEIGIDDNFFELGGHSLLVVTLMERIRQRLDVEVPLSRVLESPTIAMLAASIDEAKREATTGTGPLTYLRPGGPRRFFFIHDGEGETLLYRSLAQRLPSDFAVYGILPRRRPRVPLAHQRIEDMATHYIGEVRRRQPRGPYYLGGLCAGGVIAFEMAAQLEQAGETVEAVVLLEAFHPRAETCDGILSRRRLIRLGDVFRNPAGGPTKPAPLLPGLRRAAGKLARAARYEIASAVTELGVAARFMLLRRVLELGWAWPSWVPELAARDIYTWASRHYVPPVLRARRVILVKSTAGAPGVIGDDAGRDLYRDSLFGWGPCVASTLEILDVPGGHSTMLQEPRVAELARQLDRFLRTGT